MSSVYFLTSRRGERAEMMLENKLTEDSDLQQHSIIDCSRPIECYRILLPLLPIPSRLLHVQTLANLLKK